MNFIKSLLLFMLLNSLCCLSEILAQGYLEYATNTGDFRSKTKVVDQDTVYIDLLL